MDQLLNVEQLECDPLTRREKETPIHCAVKYGNERTQEVELALAMAEMLVEAGGDPRVKDKNGRTPHQICTPQTKTIEEMLRKAMYVANEGLRNSDVVQDDDDGPTGSASDSE